MNFVFSEERGCGKCPAEPKEGCKCTDCTGEMCNKEGLFTKFVQIFSNAYIYKEKIAIFGIRIAAATIILPIF